ALRDVLDHVDREDEVEALPVEPAEVAHDVLTSITVPVQPARPVDHRFGDVDPDDRVEWISEGLRHPAHTASEIESASAALHQAVLLDRLKDCIELRRVSHELVDVPLAAELGRVAENREERVAGRPRLPGLAESFGIPGHESDLSLSARSALSSRRCRARCHGPASRRTPADSAPIR